MSLHRSLRHAALLLIPCLPCVRAAEHRIASGGLVFTVDDATGDYAMTDGAHRFAGRLPGGAATVTEESGALKFSLSPGTEGEVCLVPSGAPALLFTRATAKGGDPASLPPFPDFTTVPSGLNVMSHKRQVFSPPSFSANAVCTPWVLFDDAGRTVIISPAAQFFTASMLGDAKTRIASGENAEVRELPAGYSGTTLVAAAPTVTGAYEKWGAALRDLHGKKPVSGTADATLAKFGILTDNAGGYYYYNYDYKEGLGYEDSIVRFLDRCRESGLPVGYLQLDSWWYHKSVWNPGERIGGIKNKALPEGDWNRYGGLLEWTAHPDVFPKGMAAFHDRVNIPFFAHNRFIDKDSPYRKRFEVSGVTALDPGYWNELGDYAFKNGIATYLQDWMDVMYDHSPETRSVPGKGARYMDNMAAAMNARGITMQYCMAYPLNMLQGVNYANLTTIRAADDGMRRSKWTRLAFNARFIRELGAWPACDVISSRDTGCMLFASLTGGPVGIGDAFEKIDRTAVFRTTRADGALVKPDEALMPLDRSYLAMAHKSGEPLLAVASTTHGARRTAYLLAFADKPGAGSTDFKATPAELGFSGEVVVWDPAAGATAVVKAGESIQGKLTGAQAYAYRIVAPVSPSGVTVLGDVGENVSMGRSRVPAYSETPEVVTMKLSFAPTESEVTVVCRAAGEIVASSDGGRAEVSPGSSGSGVFNVRVTRAAGAAGEVALTLRAR